MASRGLMIGCLAAIEATCSVHPPSRVFALLVEGATAVQTAAGKARALAAMAAIAQQMGRSRAQLAFASLPALAPLLADADAAVTPAAAAATAASASASEGESSEDAQFDGNFRPQSVSFYVRTDNERADAGRF